MAQYKEIAVGGVCYFWFAANLTTGAADDGATPLCNVRLAGAAASAAPTATPTPYLLTHATYLPGSYEVAVDTTGFAEGEYACFNSLTISAVNPGGFVGSVVVRAAAATLRDLIDAVPTRAELTSDTNSILAKLLKYVQLILRKDAAIAIDNATEKTAINADGGSGAGAFDQVTDSQEALRDRGDAAWVTATGFSTFNPAVDGVTLADGAHGGAAATLSLKQLALANADAGESCIELDATGTGNSHGIRINATNGKAIALLSTNNDGASIDSLAAKGLTVNGVTADIEADITGNVSGSVGSLATQAKADVNAEVVDALATDTYAEPAQGAPAATTTLAAKLNYLYKWTRNLKTNDGTTTKFYNDAGAVVDHKQTTSEAAGTVSKTEIISGP